MLPNTIRKPYLSWLFCLVFIMFGCGEPKQSQPQDLPPLATKIDQDIGRAHSDNGNSSDNDLVSPPSEIPPVPVFPLPPNEPPTPYWFPRGGGGKGHGHKAQCGDGITEGTEICDTTIESSTCDDDCTAPSCGDGNTNEAAGETCDTGGESATCDADCTAASCGDGNVNQAAGETCDTSGESATCDDDCTAPRCGDNNINQTTGETCDTGGESATCDDDCTAPSCGDGNTNQAAGETCDTGGESATCDADCTAVSCGDGHVNQAAGETCDTSGESATCDDDCTAPSCGDGNTNQAAGEACDTGGESATCDADCTAPLCGDNQINEAAGECLLGANTEVCDDCLTENAGATCAEMEPLCLDTTFVFPSDTNTLAEVGNNYGCLVTQPGPHWFYVNVETSGDINMSLSADADVDFIIWGPVNDVCTAIAGCGDLGSPNPPIVDCSYSPSPTESPSITGAVAGEIYIFLVTNFANVAQDITLSQTSGTGTVSCCAQ